METLGDEWLVFVIAMSAFMLLFCLSALTKKVCAAGCCADCQNEEDRLETLRRDPVHTPIILELEQLCMFSLVQQKVWGKSILLIN
jgi:hypothetical protein